MPKTRAYTREELRGLRRADLQRLCKTYDIKGANAKSEVLVETLATYFTSPAYLSSPRPEPRTRPASRLHVPHRPLHTLTRRNPKVKSPLTVPTTSSVSQAIPPVPVVVEAHHTTPAIPSTLEAGRTANEAAAATSSNDSDAQTVSALRQEISQLKETVANWEEQQEGIVSKLVEAKFAEFIGIVQRQLAVVEERETALQKREQELDAAWAQIRRGLINNNTTDEHRSATMAVPAGSVSRLASGKRKQQAVDSTGFLGEELQGDPKRARLQLGSSPHTPPPALQADASSTFVHIGTSSLPPPRTPSPGHQGTSMDQSRTPPVDPNNLNCPVFSTTPRPPREPSSPTTDHFARPDGPPPILTPGGPGFRAARSRMDRSVRMLSKAQFDLSHITDEDTESFLRPILIRKDRTVTPPALSPSPSIGGDNFTYTPLPMPSSSLAATSSVAGSSTTTWDKPPPPVSSPGREYMDIALNGLSNPNDTMVTPNSRTMLGTERYHDTRFGDEPVVPWASPTVDFGPATPSH